MKAHPARKQILETGGKYHIPIRLFGDDGTLGKRRSMTFHHWRPCCSDSSSTYISKIPLFALNERSTIKSVTDQPLLRATAWSFAAALAGVYPSHGIDDLEVTGPSRKMAGEPIAGPYRLTFVIYMANWKQSVECLHLSITTIASRCVTTASP